MNRIYRIVWNRARQAFVVASELATSDPRSLTCDGSVKHPRPKALTCAIAALLGIGAPPAWAAALQSTTPTANALNVARNTSPTLTFDTAETLTENSNFFARGSYTARYSGTFANNGSTLITFDPANDFKPGETVALSYTGSGNRKTWQFTAAVTGGSGTFTDSSQTLGNHSTRSIALGDVDNDGDLDLVEGNYQQANRVWLNTGSGTFTDSGQALGNYYTTSIALGDVDGDGDLDLVEGNYGVNRVWLNNGSGSFTDSSQTLGNHDTFSIALGDVDNDGDLDLVEGNV